MFIINGNPELQVSDEKERIAEDEFQHFCDNILNNDNSKYVYTIGNAFCYLDYSFIDLSILKFNLTGIITFHSNQEKVIFSEINLI